MCRVKLMAVLVVILVFGAGSALAADIPVPPYCEVFFATEGPLSLFCVPDGSGNPWTAAYNPLGQEVDGTMSIILYSDTPPWGEPVANYPREDFWLMDLDGDLALCQNGSISDFDTDSEGRTSWIAPMMVGGHVSPGAGNQVALYVTGWELPYPSLEVLRFNSPDLNGDLVVNLTDVFYFTQGYFGPYNYAHDFLWDGVINLSDVALMASSVGAGCP